MKSITDLGNVMVCVFQNFFPLEKYLCRSRMFLRTKHFVNIGNMRDMGVKKRETCTVI